MALPDLDLTDLHGRPLRLRDWDGRVLLVVNTASRCGFTPQLGGLQQLWARHREAGLVVLGVPSNEFGGQEPGTAEQIASFCSLEHGVDFPLLAKTEVNGPAAHPLMRWLKGAAPGLLGTEAIKWNFTKFLVGRDGQVIDRYAPQTAPARLDEAIARALAAPTPAA
ncbi:MAG: hypothetical protein RLY78_4048 [Pseudomonadota bacterium]|jgi:glutathione peroxidase|uniref:Glutathione peroxidase n=1 Tax=Pseudaquabacterium rugosum TaxID=2984194 RepID=A0ABU9BC38_9BURK